MKRAKKVFVLAVVFVMLSFTMGVFAGCNPNSGKTELILWSTPPLLANYESTLKLHPQHKEANVTKAVIEEFERRHPDVTVKITDQGWGDKLNENVIRLAGGNKYPDIIGGEVYTQSWVAMDYLAPINLRQEVKDDLLPGPLVYNTVGDKIYAVPVMTNMNEFIYNETLLKEAGLPTVWNNETEEEEVLPPATIRELMYAVERVEGMFNNKYGARSSNGIKERDSYGAYTILNQKGVGGGFRALQYLRMAGGDFVKPESVGKLTEAEDIDLNSEAAKNAFTLMRNLNTAAPFGTYAEQLQQAINNQLINGKVAMTIEHPSFILDAGNTKLKVAKMPVFTGAKDSGGMYDMTPFAYTATRRDGAAPQPEANIAVGNLCYGIAERSKNKELATEFIEMMLEPAMQESAMKYTARMPTTKKGLELAEKSEDAMVKRSLGVTKYSFDLLKRSGDPANNIVINGGLPCFSQNQYDIWVAYENFARSLYTTNSDVATLTDTLNTQVKGFLRKA